MTKHTQTSSFGVGARIGHNSSKFYNSKLYENLEIKKEKCQNDNEIMPQYLNNIFCHSSEKMPELPDNSVHLMVTSPPYNVSKDYDENLSLSEYLSLLRNVLKETYRVLVNGGRACINIANIGRKPYIPLTMYVNQIMLELGFLMRGEIIWDKSASSGVSLAWGSFKSASNPVLRDTHEYILVFSKGDFKREKKKQNKQDSISKENFMEWSKSIWRFSAVSAKKIGHPAPFPLELPKRLIEFYSFEGDVILDPFMGSGTSALAALQLKRNFVGYEINKDYVKLANHRINETKNTLF
ncbi:DNA-methyltransferase [Campylobacter helveticus]|uniref:DNA-methyltransferase n=1 Tax=Campylobacter helveticus TaxID=28898 RepID=UPI0011160CB1|nr:site-specific DNA-methyltransferase [Campylobacter helveticus]TNH32908.1 site-specific DNA-methyltransferase [Campylobacter helveticus]TNH35637.1 site-specific DNA-methyltransferase [Campylobacter helveticus]